MSKNNVHIKKQEQDLDGNGKKTHTPFKIKKEKSKRELNKIYI